MLPTSLLALTASFIAPILAAPSCTTSTNGYSAQKMVYLFNNFCAGLEESKFGSKQKYYDLPVVALGFTAGNVADCSLKECLTSFGELVDSCAKDDKSIWGTGNTASSCGTYSFEIKDTSVTQVLGAPVATIIAATMKIYDVATLTSISSSTTSTTSPSAFSATSSPSSSYVPSTTSEAQLEITYAPSTPVYFNGTTSTVASNSSTGYQSATSSAGTSTSFSGAAPRAKHTKPVVGSQRLGSGAAALSVSGASLALVAGVFAAFL